MVTGNFFSQPPVFLRRCRLRLAAAKLLVYAVVYDPLPHSRRFRPWSQCRKAVSSLGLRNAIDGLSCISALRENAADAFGMTNGGRDILYAAGQDQIARHLLRMACAALPTACIPDHKGGLR